MKYLSVAFFTILWLLSFAACTQQIIDKTNNGEPEYQSTQELKKEPHRYGGWYCPDNLNGFPPVDFVNWNKVPVVNGRMATQEETQNGTSLIFVDREKYPNAKALDISMPKLATFYSEYSNREELIIVIQAINVDKDSIVGFRYLNGGNGSARLNEIKFISEDVIAMMPRTRFVTYDLNVKATQDEVWEVLTNPDFAKNFEQVLDVDQNSHIEWWKTSNVNYHYAKAGKLKSAYAGKLFGNFYIQNDYDHLNYNEKFLLLENDENKETEIKIVIGPFTDDHKNQQRVLIDWSQKLKLLSEKE